MMIFKKIRRMMLFMSLFSMMTGMIGQMDAFPGSWLWSLIGWNTPSKKTNPLDTSLVGAILRHSNEPVYAWIEHPDTDVNEPWSNHSTALMLACTGGNIPLVERLIEAQENVDTQLYTNTALLWACERDHEEIVRILITAQAQLNTLCGFNSHTVLHEAVERNNERIVVLLLEAGADYSIKNSGGLTPLEVAIERGNIALIDCLLKAGASFDHKKAVKELHKALQYGYNKAVRGLITAGVNPNATDHSLFTPLMWAVHFKRIDTVRALLETPSAHEIDLEAKNHEGQTAFDLAQANKNEAIIALLREYRDAHEIMVKPAVSE